MKTILLIEDNQEVRENSAEILELANYKVYQADNGKTGVEMEALTGVNIALLTIYDMLKAMDKTYDVNIMHFHFICFIHGY